MVAVPAAEAQLATDRLIAAGIKGIVNFAPVTLQVPEGISRVGVDLARELEQVTFAVANRSGRLARCARPVMPRSRGSPFRAAAVIP